jgi:hypothetical protein
LGAPVGFGELLQEFTKLAFRARPSVVLKGLVCRVKGARFLPARGAQRRGGGQQKYQSAKPELHDATAPLLIRTGARATRKSSVAKFPTRRGARPIFRCHPAKSPFNTPVTTDLL